MGTSLSFPLQHRQRGRQKDRLKIALGAQVSFELRVRSWWAEGGGEKKTYDVKLNEQKEACRKVDIMKIQIWKKLEPEISLQKTVKITGLDKCLT